jgi:hypothetical protein
MNEPLPVLAQTAAAEPEAVSERPKGRSEVERIALLVLYLLTLPTLAVGLCAVSTPGALLMPLLAAFGTCVFVIAPAWLVMAMFIVFGHVRLGRIGSAEWLAIPVLGLLCAALIWSDVPLRIRFELSRGEFDRAIATNARGPQQLGLYSVGTTLDSGDGTIYVWMDEGGFLDSCGFAHRVDGAQPATYWVSLGGGWWYGCGP